jgi:LacI family transcriptional regulator
MANPTPKSKSRLFAVQVDTSTGWGRRLLGGVFQYKVGRPDLDIWTCPKSFAEEAQLPKGIKIDGLITYVNSEKEIIEVQGNSFPMINVSIFDTQKFGIPQIPPDQESPIELAYNFFRTRGFHNYAYCGPLDLAYVEDYAVRFKARIAEEHMHCNLIDINSQNLDKSLKKLQFPCAMLAWPRTVYQLLAACHSLSIRIPEELAILCQDEDELLNAYSVPPLSSIRAPASRIGFEAARLLDILVGGGKLPTESIKIECTEIIERRSTDSLAIQDPCIREVLHFVKNHFDKPFSIEDLTKIVNISRRTLERRFKNSIGHTLSYEIQDTRLRKAREMLIHSKVPIADIAPRCGFTSTEYFIYVFGKRYLTTPGQFRSNNREIVESGYGGGVDSLTEQFCF